MGYLRRSDRIFLVAVALAASGCRAADQPGEQGNEAEDPVLNLPVVPRPDPPLDRAGLLAAVAQAASRAASGQADSEAQRGLDGRPFEVRIRFGCRGPTAELDQAWLGWSFDSERRRLRVRARPTIGENEPLVEAVAPGEFEAVEGFWIPRPWLLDPVCPAAARPEPRPEPVEGAPAPELPAAATDVPPAEPATVPPEPLPLSPRIGIAQFFTDTDPRTGRRQGRPFESIQVLEEGRQPDARGFVLVLSGRLRALPGAGVIGCSARAPDSPPECIVSADFDRVWIEHPGTREIVAEWTSG